MAGRENGLAVYEDQNEMTAGENDADWENLFQLVNESAFKGYFNNEQDLGESFTVTSNNSYQEIIKPKDYGRGS
ncbi:hypothetical protein TNCV_3109291 [Trichonephila clavipes]|nr:hypothetical protein TNCV_3109291 [Trichonephila clavipes]